MAMDEQVDVRPLYRIVTEPWEPSFWERGLVRYCLMSWGLWIRLAWKHAKRMRS